MHYRCVGDSPGFAGIGGTEYASDLSTGNEPHIGVTLNRDARSAGGECAFAFAGRRERVRWNWLPVFAAIFGRDQFKSELARTIGDRVAERDAAIAIPERHAIEKAFGIFVGKLQNPVLAGVGGLVDSRLIAGACAQQVRQVGGESFHVAEVERFRTRNLSGLPGISAISRAQIGSVSAAGPGNVVGEHANATKVFGSVGFQNGGALSEQRLGKEQKHAEMKAHAMIVPEVGLWICMVCD